MRSWGWYERFSAIIISLSQKPLRFACKLKQLCMMAHDCHGKNQKPHGKTKYFTAKTKQPWFCREYLLLPWGIWFLLWSIWFCREVFGFAVRFLVLPWGFCFCREVFGFAVRYFVFAVRFLVSPWRLWATVFMKLKLKYLDLRGAEFFSIEKYNSAPSYLRHSRKLAKYGNLFKYLAHREHWHGTWIRCLH